MLLGLAPAHQVVEVVLHHLQVAVQILVDVLRLGQRFLRAVELGLQGNHLLLQLPRLLPLILQPVEQLLVLVDLHAQRLGQLAPLKDAHVAPPVSAAPVYHARKAGVGMWIVLPIMV